MFYDISYEWIEILIVNILHTVLLKKVLDTFLPAKTQNTDIQSNVNGYAEAMESRSYPVSAVLRKLLFAGYYVLTTLVYGMFHISFFYGLCNLAGMFILAYVYHAAREKTFWIGMVFFCLDTGCWSIVYCTGMKDMRIQQSAVQVLLLLICVVLICRIADSKEEQDAVLEKKQLFLLDIIPVCSTVAFVVLMYWHMAGIPVVFLGIVLVVLNICVFYLYHILLKNYIRLREQDIYKQQTLAYQNQLDVIMESQNRIRSLRHDMKNHVLALQGLAKSGKTEEMTAYLSSMQGVMQNPLEYVHTGNEALDSLLNYKLQKAQKELKQVETDIVLPEQLQLHSFDLNVIAGNLLDNAIAAAVQTEKQALTFCMRVEHGILFLYMANSCEGIPEGICDIRKLSEKSAAGHGIGLANVQRIVDKYHGDMEMCCEAQLMKTDIMLYMKEL